MGQAQNMASGAYNQNPAHPPLCSHGSVGETLAELTTLNSEQFVYTLLHCAIVSLWSISSIFTPQPLILNNFTATEKLQEWYNKCVCILQQIHQLSWCRGMARHSHNHNTIIKAQKFNIYSITSTIPSIFKFPQLSPKCPLLLFFFNPRDY